MLVEEKTFFKNLKLFNVKFEKKIIKYKLELFNPRINLQRKRRLAKNRRVRCTFNLQLYRVGIKI